MYKDEVGNHVSIGKVVELNNNFYVVEGFDNSREYNVKLRNGCVVCYAKPEQLLCIDGIGDLRGRLV